jgi:hypothetical protein
MSTETNPPVVSPNEAPAASPLSSRRGVAILLLLCLVQFMDVLDASILNIALPSIKDVWGAKTVVIGAGSLGFAGGTERPRPRRMTPKN